MSANSFTFMSIEKFNNLVEEYLNNLDPKFQEKSLISQELADVVKEVLGETDSQHPAKLKKWAKKHFATMEIGESVYLVEKKSEKLVCIKERLYDVIGELHEELQHAGYRKTYDCVSYSDYMVIITSKCIFRLNK